jgi:hypothetical protein
VMQIIPVKSFAGSCCSFLFDEILFLEMDVLLLAEPHLSLILRPYHVLRVQAHFILIVDR